jgi:hypothetical protein
MIITSSNATCSHHDIADFHLALNNNDSLQVQKRKYLYVHHCFYVNQHLICMYFYHQHVCNFTFTELISEDSGTDWMEILKTALKETEKYVLPLAIFKVYSMNTF